MAASKKPEKTAAGIAALIPGPPQTQTSPSTLVHVSPELLRAAATILDSHGDPRLAETAKAIAQTLRDAAA